MDTLVERFESKLVRAEGCWPWQAYRTPRGYGYFSVNDRLETAHRVAYQLYVGPIPEGLEVDHLCGNPSCVNPAHLEPVIHKVNSQRRFNYANGGTVKTHCLRGHPLTPENLRPNQGNHRRCRECARIHDRNRRARARGEQP